MRLSHLIEQFVLAERDTTIGTLARYFGISEDRCRQEVAAIVPYGVELTLDNRVLVAEQERSSAVRRHYAVTNN